MKFKKQTKKKPPSSSVEGKTSKNVYYRQFNLTNEKEYFTLHLLQTTCNHNFPSIDGILNLRIFFLFLSSIITRIAKTNQNTKMKCN